MKKRAITENVTCFLAGVIFFCFVNIAEVSAASPVAAQHASMTSRLQRDVDDRIARGDDAPVMVILESMAGEDLRPFIKAEKLSLRHHADNRYELTI
ncbi:MAG: hypothetical protein QG652_916, partial [Pseudomonadota bacterium]|nr:hypothetical protein [Pseudomonadota bacterium]